MGKIIAITGHRPEYIHDHTWTRHALKRSLEILRPEKIIVGMAAGADLWAAQAANLLGIPWIAAQPWAGHTHRGEDSEVYEQVLSGAVERVQVVDVKEYPGPWVYHRRNEWMVDHADSVLSIWSGKKSGGTFACMKYAQRQGKSIDFIRTDQRSFLGLTVDPRLPLSDAQYLAQHAGAVTDNAVEPLPGL